MEEAWSGIAEDTVPGVIAEADDAMQVLARIAVAHAPGQRPDVAAPGPHRGLVIGTVADGEDDEDGGLAGVADHGLDFQRLGDGGQRRAGHRDRRDRRHRAT